MIHTHTHRGPYTRSDTQRWRGEWRLEQRHRYAKLRYPNQRSIRHSGLLRARQGPIQLIDKAFNLSPVFYKSMIWKTLICVVLMSKLRYMSKLMVNWLNYENGKPALSTGKTWTHLSIDSFRFPGMVYNCLLRKTLELVSIIMISIPAKIWLLIDGSNIFNCGWYYIRSSHKFLHFSGVRHFRRSENIYVLVFP